MPYDNLKLDVSGAVATLTIDRPKALNAIDSGTIAEIQAALDELAAHDGVRALIVTGGGEKAFVAGADIKEMAPLGATAALEFSKNAHAALRRIEQLPIPVIAAVNGFALGGGCELVLACDFALASENARFGQPEVMLGVIPGMGGAVRLVRKVGPGWARRLLVTGAQIDAQQALAIGLVTEVVPQAELLDRARVLAGKVAEMAPLAVRWAKEAAQLAEETDLATGLVHEQRVFGACFATDDQKEGMSAFTEKRKPTWSGR
jgi:enoyl-CoA hydratase